MGTARVHGMARRVLPCPTMLERLRPSWIVEAGGVAEVAEACREAGGMALDTEADSLHAYFHKVCLIQVTAAGRHFLIDPLALEREELTPLLGVVADPAVTVLMHGSDYDLRVLDRDFGGRIHGLQDTQVMAQLLGEPRTGLAALIEQELGITLDKRFQRADWGQRPLPDGMLGYAAADTAFLEELAARLRRRLEDLGRWSWAEEEFLKLESIRFVQHEPDPLAFERVKGVRALRGAGRDLAFTLFEWRDATARRLDLPPFRVLGNASLVELAVRRPGTLDELVEIHGLGHRFARRWGREVLKLLENPKAAPPREHHRKADAWLTPEVRARIKRLSAVRDAVAERLSISPGLLCPRAMVEKVAACDPKVTASRGLGQCGLTGWRLQVLEEEFLGVLSGERAG